MGKRGGRFQEWDLSPLFISTNERTFVDPTPPSIEWGKLLGVKAGRNQYNQRMMRVEWENVEICYVRDNVETWRLDATFADKVYRGSGRMEHDELVAHVIRNEEVFKADKNLLDWLAVSNAEMQ